jgi:hypothetical protein
VKLTIINKTGLREEDIAPYVELAAQCVTVRGRVTSKIHFVKRGSWRWFSGFANYRGSVTIGMPRAEYFHTFEQSTLGYFAQHKIPLRKPYRIDTWQELLVSIAAHEFAHLMSSGNCNKHRKSVGELFCEERAADAVELLRSEKGQSYIRERTESINAQRCKLVAVSQAKRAALSSPDTKKARLLDARKRWTTKAKRAATALRKIERQLRRLDRVTAARTALG